MIEYDLPLKVKCDFCHGIGFWYFAGSYTKQEMEKYMSTLKIDYSNKTGECRKCQGTGYIELDELKLERD